MSRIRTADNVVDTVIEMLLDRAGFDDWWYGLDDDIQDEIANELKQKVFHLVAEFERECCGD